MRLGTVDRLESNCSLELARSTGRLNDYFFDRWPVDRPVDRKVIFDLLSCQRVEFCGGYKYPTFELFLNKFLRAKILIFSIVLIQVLERVLVPKDQSLFVLKGWKNQRKLDIWDISFDLHFNLILVVFPSIFLCVFVPNSLFFTLELILLSYLLGSLFCGKRIGLWLK